VAYRKHAKRGPSDGIGNMHKKFGKDCTCDSGDILLDRQTDRHRQMHSSQYFATTLVDEVTTQEKKWPQLKQKKTYKKLNLNLNQELLILLL